MRKIKKLTIIMLVLAILTGMAVVSSFSASATDGYYSNGFMYIIKNNEAIIVGYTGSETNVIIPATLGGKKVTYVGEPNIGLGDTVSGFENVNSVYIGNNVRGISGCAFCNYKNLKNVTIGNGVISIGDSAFANCSNLSNIKVADSVRSIAAWSFNDTAWYNNQPNGIVYIGKVAYTYKGTTPKNYTLNLKNGTVGIAFCAFSGQENIVNINIPDSVNCVGASAFDGTAWYNNQPNGVVYTGKVAYTYKGDMPKDTSIVLKKGTTGIAGRAFFYFMNATDNLKSITIPDSVKSIEYLAFCNCDNLSTINIPKSVTYIGEQAYGYSYQYKVIKGRGKYTVNGNIGSEAERYAKWNNLKFNALDVPTSVKLNRGTLTLGVGEKYGLIKTVSPSSANQACTWSSSNSSVAFVDSNGKVTAKKSGTANITVKTTNGKTATCKVTVKPAPTSVKINPANLTLGKGETYTISQSTNSGSYAWGFSWSSSNTSVATVTKGSANKATVTAKGVGTATITIKTYNGKTATCKVTVKNSPTSVTTNPTSVTLGKGETYTISENTNSGTYANAANLKWSTSNSSVATVTKGSGNKATITAKGNGTAYIKITLYNGKTAQCKVTVKNAPASVKTNPTSVTLGKGETYTISESTNSGTYANAANLKWSTSNSSVATVSKGEGNKAVVIAKGVGTAYIKITLYNGKTAQCKVTVKNAPSSVKINPENLSLSVGQTYTINESTNSGTYANAANLKWSTSNSSVATVTKGNANKATIIAKGVGTSYIKIALYNGKTAQCKVTVTSRKVYRLDNMSTYNGSRYFSLAQSGTLYSNSYVKFLPSSIRNTSGIFTIVENKIYYVEKKSGSDIQKANVYRCDIDGNNKKLIVNDYYCNGANNPSNSLIVNNKLYYKYFDGNNYGTKYIDLTNNQTKYLALPEIPYNTNNGIGYYVSNNELFSYDFISGKTEKLIAKNGNKSINIGVVIDYDDGYVYYSNTDFSVSPGSHGLYRMNISNKSKEFITKFDMEGSATFKGNNMYYTTYENNYHCLHKYDFKSKKDAFFCSMKDCNMGAVVQKDEDCLLVNELCLSGNYWTHNIYCMSFDGKTKTKVASFSTKLQ